MLIVHATRHSLTRFTPARIAAYWGRYTEHEGVCVCLGRRGGQNQHPDALNPYGIFYAQGHRGRLRALCDRADVIHCHDDLYPDALCGTKRDRPLVYHAHIGDIPKRYFAAGRFTYRRDVRHACITNGYGRHFDIEKERANVSWGRLADILDLDHPLYRPDPALRAANPRFTVVFTFSNRHEFGRKINAKCPKGTIQLLAGLNPEIELRMVTGVPFETSMAEKQRAHIVLDELFSPYTHLSALEGAAVGACVLTNYDDYTVNELCDYVGSPRNEYPFVRVRPPTVKKTIESLYENVDRVIEIGQRARTWMERYYHPERLLRRYLAFYGATW